MALNTLDAVVERRAETRTRTPRFIVPFRSLRHGAPAATFSERERLGLGLSPCTLPILRGRLFSEEAATQAPTTLPHHPR
jgi:hypothetical protein